MKIIYVWLLASALALAGCGGGGDGGASGATAANPAPGSATNTGVITSAPDLSSQTAPSTAAPVTGSALITSANSCNLPNFQADMLRAVNEARAQARVCGNLAKPAVAAVVWDDQLFAASAGHSQYMAQAEDFAHTTRAGLKLGQRVNNAGYGFSIVGENIAAGQIGIAAVMKDWLESEGHCKTIMETTFTEAAVACVTTNRQLYPTYWTMVLAKPL